MKQDSSESEPRYGPRDPLRLRASLPPHQQIRPTLTWFLVGAVAAGVMGWLALLLAAEIIGSESQRIRDIRYESASNAYSLVISEAVSAAVEDRVTFEIARALSEPGVGPDSAWADGFRRGWADGWNDALDAMQAVSLEAGAAPDSLELAALDAAPRRLEAP